jgi:hypothetical protein
MNMETTMHNEKVWHNGEWWRVYGEADGLLYLYAIISPERRTTIHA